MHLSITRKRSSKGLDDGELSLPVCGLSVGSKVGKTVCEGKQASEFKPHLKVDCFKGAYGQCPPANQCCQQNLLAKEPLGVDFKRLILLLQLSLYLPYI